MDIKFTKYQGTGNDFVILDNRDHQYKDLPVKLLCDRRFGIGADGLMLLEPSEGSDFNMVYFNSDGNLSSMCGNGGRCLVHFAHGLGMVGDTCEFTAIDGLHQAVTKGSIVELKMNDVSSIEKRGNDYILDTGSPHYVSFNDELPTENFVGLAREIRYSDEFKENGINVNFAIGAELNVSVRTYERGVEDETLSCGTGVTATAISYHFHREFGDGSFEISVATPGGDLKVRFDVNGPNYQNIWLIGPATEVYQGQINV